MGYAATRYDTPVPGVFKHTITWTSDGSGNASVSVPRLVGTLVRVVTDPGAAAPTDDYDIVLNDEAGIDILAGQGANRDTANSEHFCPGVALKDGTTTQTVPPTVAGDCTLVVSNAGSAKNGTVYLFVV